MDSIPHNPTGLTRDRQRTGRRLHRLRGAAMTEVLVVMLGLAPLALGAIQGALVFNAKTTLNYATFEAARTGALHHAQRTPMKDELARRLIPLYGGGRDTTSLAKAYAKARLDLEQPALPGTHSGAGIKIEILNPTQAAFEDFAFRDKHGRLQLPNEHLKYKPRTIGPNSGVNIQDANLLKIKVTYGYRLFVPVVNKLIATLMSRLDPANAHYYQADPPRLPIVASATVRLHSNAYLEDNAAAGGSGGGGMVGGGTPGTSGGNRGNSKNDSDEDQGGAGGDDDQHDGGDGRAESGGDENHPRDGELCLINCDHDELHNDLGNGDPALCPANPSPGTQSSALAALGVGNPIHVVTGNKYQREIDLPALPGTLGLSFVRHYNSRSERKGTLGYGWTHTYELRLSRHDQDTLSIHQADGRRVVFERTADEQYRARMAADGWLERHGETATWHWRNGRRLHFDRTARLNRITAPTGETLNLTYDRHGRLLQVTDPQDRTLGFDYYHNGRLRALFDPTGRQIRYRYDRLGNLERVTQTDGASRRYHFEDPHDAHNLTGITDARGIRYATYAYDDQDRALLSTHAEGVGKVTLNFATPGQTLVTDSQGRDSVYHTAIRDGIPLVTRIDGPGCSTCGVGDVRYEYNEQFQLTAVTQKDGISTRYAYDDNGRTTAVIRQSPGTTEQTLARYAYEGDSLKPSTILRSSLNPAGEHRLELAYNEHHQLTQLTERGYAPTEAGAFTPIERTTRLRYEGPNLIAIDGPRTEVRDIIQLTYDATHRLRQIITPDGRHQKVLAYDRYGRPTRIQSGHQTPIELAYDPRGQITEIRHASRRVTYAYTATGQLKSLAGPEGQILTLSYDDAGRATQLTGPNGQQIADHIDTEGRLIQRSLRDPGGAILTIVSYLYDAQGRLNAIEDQHGQRSQYRYDNHDRLTQIENPRGYATELNYNDLGQLLRLTQPGNVVTQFSYDAKGQNTGLTDARNNTTEYVKDDFGRILRAESPDTGITHYAYDAADNRIKKADAEAHVTTYVWDAANRLIKQENQDGKTRLSYDQATGQLAKIEGPNTTETFDYNKEGQLIEHTREIDGHTFTSRYEYDSQTHKLAQKHLPDGQTLRYHYYAEGGQEGKLRAITRDDLFGLTQTPLIGEIDHTKQDGQSGLTYGNGLRIDYTYGASGRLQGIRTQQTLQLQYTYDAQGHISGIDLNGTLQNYRYDPLDRLTEADTRLGRYRYSYDALGNRTQRQHTDTTGKTTTETYAYAPQGEGNRLIGISPLPTAGEAQGEGDQQTYTYNNSGAPTKASELSYEYNTEQRPIKVYNTDQSTQQKQRIAEYDYNSFGERIKKVVYTQGNKPKVTYYLYDGHTLTAEADEQGQITTQYLYYKGHQPIAKVEGRRIYAIHTDHLGTPRAATDNNGETVWAADYSPFGKAKIKTEKITLNLRFPGQYEDQETGTHYNYFRDYDPQTGRYVTSDPIGLKGGLNTYAYVNGDPLHDTDPLGLFLFAFDGTWNTPEDNTNVLLFEQYYNSGKGLYQKGVGTSGGLDTWTGGGLGWGARDKVQTAIDKLMELLAKPSADTTIDIVGFSRGAAVAREFANRIIQMQDDKKFAKPFTIRFLGLFDTVATGLVQSNGNSTGLCANITYDLEIHKEVKYAAQAIALNEHRGWFPVSSIESDGRNPGSDAKRVEAGFIGAHSDIGGGYGDGDLSDVALQWMIEQAKKAGVNMKPLEEEHETISNPIVHDERWRIAQILNTDRVIEYPNDPTWQAAQQTLDPYTGEEANDDDLVYQQDHPDYQTTKPFIRSDGIVNMDAYGKWLKQNRGIIVTH